MRLSILTDDNDMYIFHVSDDLVSNVTMHSIELSRVLNVTFLTI